MGNMWIINNLYNLINQCVCVQPLSGGSGTHGAHNPTPVFPVMYNWTNHLNYLSRERLSTLAVTLGEEKMHRDGHCHEAVMWFVHHVPETVRNEVANVMALPLLPYTQHSCNSKKHEVCDEYLKQVSCQDCHQDADVPVTV